MLKDWVEVELGDVLLLSSEKHKPETIENLFYIGLEHIEKDTGRLTIDVAESNINTIKNKFYTNPDRKHRKKKLVDPAVHNLAV